MWNFWSQTSLFSPRLPFRSHNTPSRLNNFIRRSHVRRHDVCCNPRLPRSLGRWSAGLMTVETKQHRHDASMSVRAPPAAHYPRVLAAHADTMPLPSHALATHANKPRAPAPVMRSPRISMPTDMRMSHAVCTVLSPTPCLRLIRFSLARSSQLGRSWDQETHGAGCFVN
jgi:hypothetical protein